MDHVLHLIAFGLVFIGACLILVARWKRVSKEIPRIWQCCRYQGGANVYTPKPMTEENAIAFASTLGSVLYVDRNHGFIFYRPKQG